VTARILSIAFPSSSFVSFQVCRSGTTSPPPCVCSQLVLVFVGLALMLALLYRSYEAHMRTEAVALTRNRKRALAAAFAQLVHGWEEAGAEGALSSTLMPLSRFAPLLSRMRPDLNSWQVRARGREGEEGGGRRRVGAAERSRAGFSLSSRRVRQGREGGARRWPGITWQLRRRCFVRLCRHRQRCRVG
jgi:hypothetical protein